MTFRKHRIFAAIPAALLVFVLIALLAVTLTGPIAEAEETKIAATEQSEITFAQMSDIHYFPYQHCYPHDMADYLESDFYHSTTGDTKLVIESGSLLMAHIEEIIADAHEGVAPMYLFTTGDLCKTANRLPSSMSQTRCVTCRTRSAKSAGTRTSRCLQRSATTTSTTPRASSTT